MKPITIFLILVFAVLSNCKSERKLTHTHDSKKRLNFEELNKLNFTRNSNKNSNINENLNQNSHKNKKQISNKSILINDFIDQISDDSLEFQQDDDSDQATLSKKLVLNINDPSSFSNSNEVVQTHVNVIYKINPFIKRVYGDAKLFYKCITPKKYIILDISSLEIKNIFDKEGNKLSFFINVPLNTPDNMGEGLVIYLTPNKDNCVTGSTSFLRIQYKIKKDAVGVQFHSADLLENKNIPMFSTKGEAINARSYVPCQDTPSAKLSTSAEIIYPEGFTALYSGEIVKYQEYLNYITKDLGVSNKEFEKNFLFNKGINNDISSQALISELRNTKNKRVIKKVNSHKKINYISTYFIMKKVIPSYLITITLGYFEFIDIENSICRVYYEKVPIPTLKSIEFIEKIKTTFATCQAYYSYFNAIYPYSLFNDSNNPSNKIVFVILPTDFYSSGMENPNTIYLNEHVITDDGSYHNVVGHEIAHFWAGNFITCLNFKYFWINEGITTYLQRRAIRSILKNTFYKTNGNKLELGDTDLIDDNKLVVLKNSRKNNNLDKANLTNVGDLIFATELNFARFGLTKAIKESLELKQPKDKRMLEPEVEGDPFMFYSRVAYDKGCLMMIALEKEIGENNMNLFLHNFFKTYAYKSITGDDFKAFLQDFTATNNIKFKNSVFNINTWFDEEKVDTSSLSKGLPTFASENINKISKKIFLIGTLTSNANKKNIYSETYKILRNLEKRTLALVLGKVSDLIEKYNKSKNSKKNTNKKLLVTEYIGEFIKYCANQSDIFSDLSSLDNSSRVLQLKTISDKKKQFKKAIKLFNKQTWFNKKYHKEILKIVAKSNTSVAEKLLKRKKKYMSNFVFKYFSHIVNQLKFKKA